MGIQVTIDAPDFVQRGTTLRLCVVVENSGQPQRLAGVTVRVRGHERWKITSLSRSSSPHREEDYLAETLSAAGPTMLPTGRSEYRLEIAIPSTAAPTHDTTPAFAELRIIASVKRAWYRTDVSRLTWIAVRAASALPPRDPATVRSANGELEVSIASRTLAIGEPVIGWVTHRPPKGKAEEVRVRFEAHTQCFLRDGDTAIESTFPWRDREFELPANRPRPFFLALPATTPPSFDARTHARSWQLIVETARRFVADTRVAIPLVLVDPIAPPEGIASDAPRLAGDQLVVAFAALGSRWTLVPHDLVDETHGILLPAVRHTDGAIIAELGVALGEQRHALVGRVRCELGIDTVPASSLGEPASRTGRVITWSTQLADDPAAQIATTAVELARIVEAIARATRPDDAPYR